MTEIIGYHGTSLKSTELIVRSNYKLSIGDDEWLGNGVYFFVHGISSKPEIQAKKWAIAHAWDNISKEYKYKKYCVIKSIIQVNEQNLLDLTKEDGVEVLNYLIERFESVLRKTNRKLNYIDGLVLNLARNEKVLDIDVVKGNFYIKFAEERINNINRRTPNCTICTVYNPEKNIVENKIISTEELSNEIN